MSPFRDLSTTLILATLTASVSAPVAAAGYPKTDAEFARLPPYCKARMSDDNGAAYNHWQGVFGRANFVHLHHYCAALNDLNTARRDFANPEQQRNVLEAAVKNFTYVERMTRPDFFLRPEVSVQKGKALVLLGRTAEAVQNFNSAIVFRPDYTPAYAALSDLYVDLGEKHKASEILQRGLKAKPDSKVLHKRLQRLNTD